MKPLRRHSPPWLWPGAHRRVLRVLGVLLALAVTVAACSTVQGEASPTGGQPAASDDPLSLAGVCPDRVTAQTSWWLQIEHFAAFALLGEGWDADSEEKVVRGPLVAQGKDTGVELEIRAGGPAVGFDPVSARLYLDEEITFGLAPLDEIVQLSADQPTIGVLAAFELDPQVILWSPEEHPEWNTVVDIGQTDATVLYNAAVGTYMDYLVGSGILRESQVDDSFGGSHDRFVAEGGRNIATQEFLTNGPYRLQYEIPQWGRPVEAQLIHDTGYPNYRHMMIVRADKLEDLTPCLERLVPIVQQGIVDVMSDPEPTIELVQAVREASGQEDQDSLDRARHAIEVMTTEQLVSNGPDDTIGNFDPERVQELMDIVIPIYRGQNVELPEDLAPDDVTTNRFIDPEISLPVVAASPAPTP